MRFYWWEWPWCQKMGGKAIEIFSDSRLVVGQVKGELEAKKRENAGIFETG